MTTIAFDGRYLAADTLTNRDGNRSERPLCKLVVHEGVAYATGGHWWAIHNALVSWHQAGHPIADYPNPRGLDGALLAVHADNRQAAVFTHEAPYPDQESFPVALGSGGDLALGAMAAGVTAMEAVEIAARFDLKTGCPIDFVDLEWIEKGVQRWDHFMPSRKRPMPLNTPLGGDRKYPVVRTVRGVPIRDYVNFDNWKDGEGAGVVPLDAPADITANVADITARFTVTDGPATAVASYTYDNGLEGSFEYKEILVSDMCSEDKCISNFRREFAEALAPHINGQLLWRIRPELMRYRRHDEDRIAWKAYVRFALIPLGAQVDAAPVDLTDWRKDETTGSLEFEAVDIPKPVVTVLGATCRGSYALGGACRQCERCLREWQTMQRVSLEVARGLAPKTVEPFKLTGNGKTARRVAEVAQSMLEDPEGCSREQKTLEELRQRTNLYPV